MLGLLPYFALWILLFYTDWYFGRVIGRCDDVEES
jgi:hypothetical protein